MKKQLVILFLLAAGCAGSGGGSSASSVSGLFKLWTASSATFDLTNGAFGNSAWHYTFTNGQVCACTLDIDGAQASGMWSIYACSYSVGTGAPAVDPGCTSVEDGGSYSQSATALHVCSTASGVVCTDYH